MHSCVKLPQFLEEAQKDGWTVAGTSGDGETVACTAFKPTKPVALVVGKLYAINTFAVFQFPTPFQRAFCKLKFSGTQVMRVTV